MTEVVVAPEWWTWRDSRAGVFLAGGITDCPTWQDEVIDKIKAKPELDLVLLNPRRANFPIDDPNAAAEQIRWEFEHLRAATARLFWFPCETLCPIVLYELGAWSRTWEPMFVGCHPDYQRRADVEIQTKLARPDVTVVSSLDALVTQIAVVAAAHEWGAQHDR